jgi:hypothetical protein
MMHMVTQAYGLVTPCDVSSFTRAGDERDGEALRPGAGAGAGGDRPFLQGHSACPGCKGHYLKMTALHQSGWKQRWQIWDFFFLFGGTGI